MNHREETRIGAWAPATATILGHPDVTVPCQIVNFSLSGICIVVGLQIPEGHAVKVDWDRHFLVGRVQRVSAMGPGFEIGLQLLHCSQWQDADQHVAAIA